MIDDYQIRQYEEESKRTVLFDEQEVKLITKAIKHWKDNLVVYHNYYEDVEFIDSIEYFLNKDGRLSHKQIKRFQHMELSDPYEELL